MKEPVVLKNLWNCWTTLCKIDARVTNICSCNPFKSVWLTVIHLNPSFGYSYGLDSRNSLDQFADDFIVRHNRPQADIAPVQGLILLAEELRCVLGGCRRRDENPLWKERQSGGEDRFVFWTMVGFWLAGITSHILLTLAPSCLDKQ